MVYEYLLEYTEECCHKDVREDPLAATKYMVKNYETAKLRTLDAIESWKHNH